jgi:hypothetical protein
MNEWKNWRSDSLGRADLAIVKPLRAKPAPKPMRETSNFRELFQRRLSFGRLPRRIALRFSEISDFLMPSRLGRGAYALSSRHVRRDAMAVTATRAISRADERRRCGRRNRVVLAPRRWR